MLTRGGRLHRGGGGDAVSPGQALPPDGLYLTYDSDRPLILLYKGRGWVFKDLYALLYLHLQMRDDSA